MQEEVYEAYSEVLSLMYLIPNIAIGFTGAISSCTCQTTAGEALPLDSPYTHALHFRFADRKAAEDYVWHPLKTEKYNESLDPAVSSYCEILFDGRVEKDMDAMFRRSGTLPLQLSDCDTDLFHTGAF